MGRLLPERAGQWLVTGGLQSGERVIVDGFQKIVRARRAGDPGAVAACSGGVVGTGQATLRAEVPSPASLLLPGQFVRVRLAQASLPAAILLPQQAVTRSPQGDSVLLVGEGNKPQPRTVQLAGTRDGQWIVTGGLQRGERVIVDVFQKMFVPGAPVTPVPWQPATASSAPVAASAASR